MKKIFSTLLAPSVLAAASIAIASSSFSAAQAATTSFTINQFTGATTQVRFTLDDTIDGAGKVQFKVDYLGGTNALADIRGIFFNIKDDSLLSGLKVSGTDDITTSKFGPAGTIGSVGNANLNGGGGPKNFFDAGIEIGTQGIGKGDDFQSTTFTLSHLTQALTLDQFYSQDFGVRLTSVSSEKSREDSSKLKGISSTKPTQPKKVPEPTTIPALGLFAIGVLKLTAKNKKLVSQA
jgi:hypothetical protein